MVLERISVEVSRHCDKGYPYCDNGSNLIGETTWTPEIPVRFVTNCAENGVRASFFGGGEPHRTRGSSKSLPVFVSASSGR